jgi:hypothetical protein
MAAWRIPDFSVLPHADALTLEVLRHGSMDAAACHDTTEVQMNGLASGRVYGIDCNGTSTFLLSKMRSNPRTSQKTSDANKTNGKDVLKSLDRWVPALVSAPLPTTSTHAAEARIAQHDLQIDRFTANHPEHLEIPSHRRK